MLVRRSNQVSYKATDVGSWSFVGWNVPVMNESVNEMLPNINAFIAQLVRASHWHRKVTGSNPVEVLKFSGFSTHLLKLRP